MIRTATPYLSLSPNALTTYLSKLFLVLREAALAAIEASHRRVEQDRFQRAEEEKKRTGELEASLAAMQAQLGIF